MDKRQNLNKLQMHFRKIEQAISEIQGQLFGIEVDVASMDLTTRRLNQEITEFHQVLIRKYGELVNQEP